MTLDGGWGLIIATVVGVVLVWVGNLIAKHFDNSEDSAEKAHERIGDLGEKLSELAMDQLRHQQHVAETYVKQSTLERLEAKIDRLLERGGLHHD